MHDIRTLAASHPDPTRPLTTRTGPTTTSLRPWCSDSASDLEADMAMAIAVGIAADGSRFFEGLSSNASVCSGSEAGAEAS
jgi:hypothetical protein